MAVKTPHIAAPFSFTGTSLGVVEQDSASEIRQCVIACLSTRRGSRMDSPNFGIPNHLFNRLTARPNVDDYLAAIEESEPRAHVLGKAEIEGMIEQIIFKLEPAGV